MADDSVTTAASHPDPALMRGVISYLSLDGRAGEAADFFARAFGARDLGRYPDADHPGRLMHVQVEINGGCLMMTDCRAPWEAEAPTPQGFNLMLVVGDGEAWWSRAVNAGCTVVMPFERQFWGDRWGLLRDPFGFHWAIDEPGDSAP
ncbi:MAG: glyoxalase/bleomycin resistance/extradiol dioxygenase family protein [Rhodospirillales bacterium]|nr:MAG: glyoxalase/bleomycin resistance/extradiol dioxygenase family protein [Rhodospirillales bacterium]